MLKVFFNSLKMSYDFKLNEKDLKVFLNRKIFVLLKKNKLIMVVSKIRFFTGGKSIFLILLYLIFLQFSVIQKLTKTVVSSAVLKS